MLIKCYNSHVKILSNYWRTRFIILCGTRRCVKLNLVDTYIIPRLCLNLQLSEANSPEAKILCCHTAEVHLLFDTNSLFDILLCSSAQFQLTSSIHVPDNILANKLLTYLKSYVAYYEYNPDNDSYCDSCIVHFYRLV